MNSNGGSLLYDLILWLFTVAFDIFFRQVLPRGAYRIPRTGPVIFVGAPHANQFVDPVLLMQQVRYNAGRRISFLIAEKSFRHSVIGPLSRCVHAIPVVRAQDNLSPARGSIYIKSIASGDSLQHIFGKGTRFTTDCMAKGLIGLRHGLGTAEIAEIINDEELVLKKPFKTKALETLSKSKNGLSFSTAAHVDQSTMFKEVFDHLHNGRCLGIFPEGGSHDRSDLLPLKAGVAIMALGSIASDPSCDVKIVPCGMNYFHPHKFRSRAVVEFGSPVSIPSELVDAYKKGGEEKREAIKKTLDLITDSLRNVTVTTPDFDTLMTIQAARRLYRPTNKKLPLSVQVEMTRRLIEGHDRFRDTPEIQHLYKSVARYNKKLQDIGIKDHSVEETPSLGTFTILATLIYRFLKLVVLTALSLPGAILFAPIFVATKKFSNRKARMALKASTVKIKANDVIATWKVLVALGLAPLLYTVYSLLAVYVAVRYQCISNSWSSFFLVFFTSMIILALLSYSALIIGESGMDIFKSLPPLAYALDPRHKSTLEDLKRTRHELVTEITEVVNELGPRVFPDFDARQQELFGIKAPKSSRTKSTMDFPAKHQSRPSTSTLFSEGGDPHSLSRVASDNDISNVPLFSSSWNDDSETSMRSRASSASSITSMSSQEGSPSPDEASTTSLRVNESEISKRIREAMSELQKSRQ